MTGLAITIILLTILAFLAITFIIALAVQRQTFRPIQIEKYSSLKHYSDYKDRYARRPVRFPSGKNQLTGAVYTPKGGLDRARGLIVFAHGIWSGPEEYLMLILWLVDWGYAVFTYNATSYNGSEGSWARGLYQSPLDLNAALTFISKERKLSKLPRYLLGHSWGGFAVTAVLNFCPEVRGVISLSGFDQPMKMTMAVAHKMFGGIAGIFHLPLAVINRCIFGKNVKLSAVSGINRTKAPVLLVHGKEDDFIGFDTTSIISQKDRISNPNLKTITLDEPGFCGHNSYFLSKESEAYAEEINHKFEEEEKKITKKSLKVAARPAAKNSGKERGKGEEKASRTTAGKVSEKALQKTGRITKKMVEEEKQAFRKSYYQSIDREKTNLPNDELYEKLYDFLKSCENKEKESCQE